MMSTIITGGSPLSREEEAFRLCDSLSIHPLDRYVFSQARPEEKSQTEERIGIGLVRKIQQKILLKPLYSQSSAVLIEDAQALTLPAQQALLKLLEEPPQHTVVFLTAENEAALLPTIRSRCKVIVVANKDEEVKSNLVERLLDSLRVSLGERLLLAEALAKDVDNKTVIKQYIRELRKQLHTAVASNKERAHILFLMTQAKQAQELHALLIETNVNQRLLFEHFLLLPRY